MLDLRSMKAAYEHTNPLSKKQGNRTSVLSDNFSQLSSIFKEVLWPTRCAICERQGELLCKECKQKLQLIDSCKACKICGSPYAKNQCTECNDVMLKSAQLTTFPYKQMRSVVALNDDALKIIKVYKDGFERRLAVPISLMMSRYVEPSWIDKNAIITYIPSTLEAINKRGFGHMQEIATLIGQICKLDVVNVFSRPKSSDQRNLSRIQRIENVQNSLKINEKVACELLAKLNASHINQAATPVFSGQCNSQRNFLQQKKKLQCKMRPVLVIDDVCTTGSTLYAAANALKEIGVKTTYALTFGKVMN